MDENSHQRIPPHTPATSDLSTFSTVLLFPESRTVGISQYVAFQTGFFHLVICI